jgi:transcriptional regulator with XRE-family HTH domain
MDWAQRTKLLRRRLFLKQAALAEALNVDQSAISRWEQGHDRPNVRARKMMLDMWSNAAPAPADDARLRARVRLSESLVLIREDGVFEELSDSLSNLFKRDRSEVIGRRNSETMLDEGAGVRDMDRLFRDNGDVAFAKVANGGRDADGGLIYTIADMFPVVTSGLDILTKVCATVVSEERYKAFLEEHGCNRKFWTFEG